MTGAEIVTAVRDQGGFDNARADVLAWANEKYRDLVVRAKWRMGEVTIATTVAGTGAYDLPAADTDLDALTVVDPTGGDLGPYQRVGETVIWDLKRSTASLSGSGGVFAPYFTSDGTPQVQLYPVPTVSGQQILGLTAMTPADLTDSAVSTPIVPSDFHGAIRDGATGLGYQLMEERWDLATPWNQAFENAVVMLRRRKNSRIGSGPTRIKVAGYDFD